MMAPHKAMAPRKEHRKTRSGCVQCKRRKCDEDGCPSTPATPGDSSYASHSPQSVQPPTRNDEEFAHGGQNRREEHADGGLNRREELCLVHHYTTSAYLGLTRHEADADLWKDLPFYDGLKYEFVLDAVLAIAALHKAHLEPANSEKYTSACLHYQSRSLRGYQAQLSAIDDENCHGMFAVAALVHVITIAMSRGGPNLLPTSPFEALLTGYSLLKGVQVVLRSSWLTIKAAHYQRILTLPPVSPDLTVSTEVSQAMEELRRSAADAARTTKAATLDLYNTAIDALEEAFRKVEHAQIAGEIAAWPISVGDEGVELLKRRDPMMLLIFVHYGVLYLHIHDKWWAHNYGRRIILDLSEDLHALDAAWFSSTSWARARAAKLRDVPPS
ncbi:hypothetical protein Q7P37_006523 [Cladosporium fusiforme]